MRIPDAKLAEIWDQGFTIVEGWNMHELRLALKNAPAMQHLLALTSDTALMQQLGRLRAARRLSCLKFESVYDGA